MRWLGRRHPLFRCATLALTLLPVAAGPLWACSNHSSVWDWDRCWVSLPRWLLLAAAGAGWQGGHHFNHRFAGLLGDEASR